MAVCRKILACAFCGLGLRYLWYYMEGSHGLHPGKFADNEEDGEELICWRPGLSFPGDISESHRRRRRGDKEGRDDKEDRGSKWAYVKKITKALIETS